MRELTQNERIALKKRNQKLKACGERPLTVAEFIRFKNPVVRVWGPKSSGKKRDLEGLDA